MITVYTVTYNEEFIIEFFINHYRKIFPNCKIVVYDNYSTDRTVEIAKSFDCDVKYYDTNNRFSDKKIIDIKNNCWKTSKTDWVVVCDCDELIQISEENLKIEEKGGITIFKFNGYNVMNNNDSEVDLENLSFGWPDKSYDKVLLFNKNKIKEINYNYGCHDLNPVGNIKISNRYDMYHYKFLGKDHTINRYKVFAKRMSEENKTLGLSYHFYSTVEEICKLYDNNKEYLIKLKI